MRRELKNPAILYSQVAMIKTKPQRALQKTLRGTHARLSLTRESRVAVCGSGQESDIVARGGKN